MAKQPAKPIIRLRIDVGPTSSIGPGKIALLERIEATGSLSRAARELGMSYRRAWLLLDDLNHAFSEPATIMSVGGAGGGGAQLTALGKALIGAYREIEHAAGEVARVRLSWLHESQPAARAPTAATRRPVTRSIVHPPAVDAQTTKRSSQRAGTRGRAAKRN